MAWNIIRKATKEDYERLLDVEKRFVKRHPSVALFEDNLEDVENPRLRKLWRRCIARTLRHPKARGIAYGFVGYSVV